MRFRIHIWTVVWASLLLLSLIFLNVANVGWPFQVFGRAIQEFLIEALLLDVVIGIVLVGLSTWQVEHACRLSARSMPEDASDDSLNSRKSNCRFCDGLAVVGVIACSIWLLTRTGLQDKGDANVVVLNVALLSITLSWFSIMRVISRTKLRRSEPDASDEPASISSRPWRNGWVFLAGLLFLSACLFTSLSVNVIPGLNSPEPDMPYVLRNSPGQFGWPLVFATSGSRQWLIVANWQLSPVWMFLNLAIWLMVGLAACHLVMRLYHTTKVQLKVTHIMAITASLATISVLVTGGQASQNAQTLAANLQELFFGVSVFVFAIGVAAFVAWLLHSMDRVVRAGLAGELSWRKFALRLGVVLVAFLSLAIVSYFVWRRTSSEEQVTKKNETSYASNSKSLPKPQSVTDFVAWIKTFGSSARVEGAVSGKISLDYLSRLNSLQPVGVLRFNDIAIKDLSMLKKLGSLEELHLTKCEIGDLDLSVLSGINTLTTISLKGSPVRDLSALKGLTGLQVLNLTETAVRDLSPLSGMALRELAINKTSVDDLSPLSGLGISLEHLLLTSSQVRDLTPLQGLVNLRTLWVADTPVRDITPLAPLVNLQWLDLQATRVSDLTPLSRHTKLELLYVSGRQITDISPVRNMTKLKRLSLVGVGASDFAALANLQGLQVLTLAGTRMNDLTPLAGLSDLEELNLRRTFVSDLAPLGSLSKLKDLDLTQTKVTEITPLRSLNNLKDLVLEQTQVSDLTPLTGLKQLEKLDLTGTKIRTIAPLQSLTGLLGLDLDGTTISDLAPLQRLTFLVNLDLSNTKVADLSALGDLSQLRRLEMDGTPLSELGPVEDLTSLQVLLLDYTQVTDLKPLSKLTSLRLIDLTETNVKDLTALGVLADLRELNLYATEVTDLTPLRNLKKLETLNLNKTNVSDLSPLHELTNLRSVGIYATKVTDEEAERLRRALPNCKVVE